MWLVGSTRRIAKKSRCGEVQGKLLVGSSSSIRRKIRPNSTNTRIPFYPVARLSELTTAEFVKIPWFGGFLSRAFRKAIEKNGGDT
jgi:hypothetical protein